VNLITAEIIADSCTDVKYHQDAPGVSPSRLTTFILRFPRIVLAEMNTHRMISKNSASSRAIPFKKMVAMVEDEPFIPLAFQKDHSGMQGNEYLEGEQLEIAKKRWLEARDSAVKMARTLNEESGVTKQLCNRVLEPFLMHTVIATASDWANFFALRAHPAAEIHIADLAHKMLKAYNESKPKYLATGEWHIPFGDRFDEGRLVGFTMDSSKRELEELKVKIAVARCARVSYMNFEGKDDYAADFKLHDILASQGHWSPFEHCAVAANFDGYIGNFKGFRQYRKQFDGENRSDHRIK
jgi:thymidylate synthase ThyX